MLIAAELRELLDSSSLQGLDVTWIRSDEPTPGGDYVALVPLLSRWIGGTELKRLPKLQVVANCAVGYNNVDLVAAEMRRVIVTNTPDVLTAATADLTWALILACARRLLAGVDLVKTGGWSGWHPQLLLGLELEGATLGIVGAGRIGQAVGKRATGFGMRIRYASRAEKPEFEQATGATRLELKPLLRESDVVTLHVPRTPETQGMINADTLAMMKPGAILINTSRGDLVREEAVAVALEQGRPGAAGARCVHGRAGDPSPAAGRAKDGPASAPRVGDAPYQAENGRDCRSQRAGGAVGGAAVDPGGALVSFHARNDPPQRTQHSPRRPCLCAGASAYGSRGSGAGACRGPAGAHRHSAAGSGAGRASGADDRER